MPITIVALEFISLFRVLVMCFDCKFIISPTILYHIRWPNYTIRQNSMPYMYSELSTKPEIYVTLYKRWE